MYSSPENGLIDEVLSECPIASRNFVTGCLMNDVTEASVQSLSRCFYVAKRKGGLPPSAAEDSYAGSGHDYPATAETF